MSIPILAFFGFAFAGLLHSAIFSFLAIKTKNPANLIITLFLFIQSFIILEYVFFWTGMNKQYHYLNNISLTTQFLFGPLLYMYVDFVFYENKKYKNYVLHFLPAVLVFILMLPFYFNSTVLKVSYYKQIKYFVLDLDVVTFCIMAHMLFYFIIIIYRILREKRVGYIKNWLLIINGLFGFYTACYISYFIMVNQPWFTLTTDYFVSIGMCASIVAIIYFAYARKQILDGFPISESLIPENIYFSYKETTAQNKSGKKKEPSIIYNYDVSIDADTSQKNVLFETASEKTIQTDPVKEPDTVKYRNSGLTTDSGHELAEALKQLMQKEKLYRESELKLETLAQKLDVPKHYVSQVINQYYSVNFFEYINTLRIQEAKHLLISTDKPVMNIIEIAYAVGFSTKNTFNSAFRRIVGITPTEYRNKNKILMN